MRAIVSKNERGFTLAETMVVTVLTALGVLAATSMFNQLTRSQRAAQGAAALSDYVSLISAALAHPETTQLNNCTQALKLPQASLAGFPAKLSQVPASLTLKNQGLLLHTANIPNLIQTSDGNIYSLTLSGQQVAQYSPGHILPSTNKPFASGNIALYHGNLTLQVQRRGASASDVLGGNLTANIPVSLELDQGGIIQSCSTRQPDTDLTPPGSGILAHSSNDCLNQGGIPVQGTAGSLTCHFVDYTSTYGLGTNGMTTNCPEGFLQSGKNCVVESPPEQISVPSCPSGWTATAGSQNTICTQTTPAQQGSCPNAIPCPQPTSITPIYNSTMTKNGNTPTFNTTGVQVYQNTGQVQNVTPPQPSGVPIPPGATCSVTTTCKFNTAITCPSAPAGTTGTSGSWVLTAPGTCTYQITSCPIPLQQTSSAPLTCYMANISPSVYTSPNPGTTGICPQGWTKVQTVAGGVGLPGVNCQ